MELADQVFADSLVKAYHKKHPLDGRETPTLATHLWTALAKSHWHPHTPLTNFGVTGPMIKQDFIGAPKISAPMVLTTSGTMKNMSTLMPQAATPSNKPTVIANAFRKGVFKMFIHNHLAKSLCQTHTLLPPPTASTEGQITVVCCNMPLNALRLLVTMTVTLTHRQSASTPKNASLSWKAFPISTQCSPVEAIYCPWNQDWSLSLAMESIKQHAEQLEQALTIISCGATSSQTRGQCHGTAGMHAREPQGHMQVPNDGVRQTSWGQIER